MLLHNLTPNIVVKRLTVDGTNWTGAAGTSALTSDIVDTRGFYGIVFKIAFGTITSGAVTSFKVQQGNIANMSDAEDIAGSAQTVLDTNDNKIFISSFMRPYKRYLRLVTSRATQNAVVDYLEVILYAPADVFVTQDATVAGYEQFNGSAAGTA